MDFFIFVRASKSRGRFLRAPRERKYHQFICQRHGHVAISRIHFGGSKFTQVWGALGSFARPHLQRPSHTVVILVLVIFAVIVLIDIVLVVIVAIVVVAVLILIILFTLGAKGYLTSRYIEITLRFFKQFVQQVSGRYMLITFKKYPPRRPVGTF